jgi:hypothetical protein
LATSLTSADSISSAVLYALDSHGTDTTSAGASL